MSLSDIPNVRTEPYQYFSGQTLVFDGYICLYQFLTGIRDRDNGDYIRNTDNQPISHLLGIMNRFGSLLEAGIEPVFVLDGGYPELKSETVQSRGESTERAQRNYEEAAARGDTDAMQKWGPRRVTVTDEMLDGATRTLEAMGIPVVQAPSEGEPQCAYLVESGLADYAVSEDYDTALYHPSMVRNCNQSNADVLDFANPLAERGWSHEEMVWYAIVLGTDYNTSPYGVGPKGAYDIVDQAVDFTDVVELSQSADERAVVDAERWFATRDWFMNPDVRELSSLPAVSFDADEVRRVLVDEYKLLEAQVESKIANIQEDN